MFYKIIAEEKLMDNKKMLKVFVPKASFYLWIIFFLISVISVLDLRIGLFGYAAFIFLVYYSFRNNFLRKSEITKYIENLTLNIDLVTKDVLLNLPIPLVVTQLDGTVSWYNSSFKSIFEEDDLLEKSITSLIKDFDVSIFNNELITTLKGITINGKNYNIYGNLVKTYDDLSEDNFIRVFYFIDNSEIIDIKKRYESERIGVCIITIDNYDDLMQSINDDKRSQLLAEIDKRIVNNFAFTKGIAKKFERDKYLLVFEIKYLKEFEDEKFDLLDSIKEIKLGNKIPVTLSIGFGVNASTLGENLQYAVASIDIALGRGGDQVVIKNNQDIKFFGGKTRELEKKTKVKARVKSFAIRQLIDQASMVLIMGHQNCDIDSLGAAIGLYRIIVNRKKDAYIVLSKSNPTIEKLMAKIEKNSEYDGVFIGKTEAMSKINNKVLLIVVDTYRPGFTECPELLKMTNQIIVIDHHRRGAENIQDTLLTYQEIYASSTSELVTELLQYVDEDIKLTEIEAEALYAGIVVDTKNFTFKTGVRTFEAAAYLRRQGVDTVSVKQIFQNDLRSYIYISNVVQSAQIIYDNIAISECSVSVKNVQLIAAQAADQLLSLSGISVAFVLSSINGDIYISGRSLGDVNVQVILEKLGGGGHMTVAGAQIKDITNKEAKEKLMVAIDEYIQASNKEP